MNESKEFRDYTKNESVKIAIESHKKKWEGIDEDNFQPLSHASKKVKSKYKFFRIDKKDLNKKLNKNYNADI